MSALTEFLFPAPARRSAGSIFTWWERRRPAYNLIVGVSGTLSLGTALVLAMLPPGGIAFPGLPWEGIVAFGLMANFFYFLGPLAEIAIDKLWGREVLPTGPALFRMGLTFSVGLTFVPTLLMVVFWVLRVVGVVPT